MNWLVAMGLATDDAPATPNKAAVAPGPSPFNTTTPVPTTLAPGAVDSSKEQNITDKLQQALMTGKLPGISYADFVVMYSTMEKSLGFADEKTKFMAAWAALAGQGATPDSIINTAQHYIDILSKEENEFGQMLSGRLATEVQSKINEQANLDAHIADCNQKIQDLTKEIMDSNIKKIELGNAAAQAKSDLESYASTFKSAKDKILAHIEENLMKFKGYIVPANK